MHTLSIEIPEDILLATGQSRDEFIREAKFLLAAKLFEMGRLSSGKASSMCNMPRVDFLLALGRIGISAMNLEPEDLQRELDDLKRAAGDA